MKTKTLLAVALAALGLALACGDEAPEWPALDTPPQREVVENDPYGVDKDAGAPDAGAASADAGRTDGGHAPDGGPACGADTWASYAKSFMTAHCTRCHSSLSNYSTVKANAGAIKSDVRNGYMPRNETLSAAEKARIVGWIDCGMPQ